MEGLDVSPGFGIQIRFSKIKMLLSIDVAIKTNVDKTVTLL